MKNSDQGQIGYLELVSIGIGGMVGGGIFAVLGLSVQLSHGGAPVAFAIAGAVAILTAYSYARLSTYLPGQGGTVTFLDKAFGSGLFTGGINVLLWLSYIVMLSLYSYAFGSYGASFFPENTQAVWKHIFISGSVVVITGLNMFSAEVIGRAESYIVALKLAILVLFIMLGIRGINMERITPGSWSPPLELVAGGMIIFLAYEGFELIANAAADTKNPKKTLPRAFYSSVVIVILLYVLVAAVATGNLPIEKIVAAKDYALAEAAKPFLGNFGFTLIAVAALLSTASAINATFYGSTKLSYTIAKDGELPSGLERKVWNEPIEGLLITSGTTLLIANLFNLSSISTMGSAGFLIIFAAVNAANMRLSKDTQSHAWISALGMAACLLALGALFWQTAGTDPIRILVLGAMLLLAFAIEFVYRYVRKREIRLSRK